MKNLRFTIILLSLMCFGIENVGAIIVSCSDVTCTELTITKVTYSTNNVIYYDYTLQNVGNDTLWIKNIVLQNYIRTDSSSTAGTGLSAGGTYINNTSSDYILPGATYSSNYHAGNANSFVSYPFLVVHFYLSGDTECSTTNNDGIKSIPLPDISVTDITITNVYNTGSTNMINFNYTIKNIGSDSLNISDVLCQTSIGTDSSYTTGTQLAAGGSYIFGAPISKLLPDSSFTYNFTSTNANSLETYSYLIAHIYLDNNSDSVPENDYGIAKINLPTIVPEQEIISGINWSSDNCTFTVQGKCGENMNYSIMNMNGSTVETDKGTIGSPVKLNLPMGHYILRIETDKETSVTKIIIK